MDTRELSAIIEAAAEKIRPMAGGTLIPHISLAEMLGVKYKDRKYYSMVNKLSNHLRSRYGIFLKTEHKAGYQIVLPGEEIDLCEGKAEQGIKFVIKSVKHMNDIDMDRVPQEKRERTVAKANKYGNIVGMLRLGAKEVKQIS